MIGGQMKYVWLIIVCWLWNISVVNAQRHTVYGENIKSLQVMGNGDWTALPIIELDRGSITIDFDDLTHTYHRYTYDVEHYEANWQKQSSIFDSDYIEGFSQDNLIENIQESTLTNTLYTHYNITIPNEKCRPKISGNYVLTVYDEDHNAVLKACFMITEPQERMMGVGLSVTTNTDATINDKHQQVGMEIKYGNYTITNPAQQITTIVLQNRRWDNARWNSKPQYTLPDGLRWTHCKDYIFLAGNEYRKFEILSTDVATMGIEHLRWDGTNFFAYPFLATPRPNYLYDKDANGAFVIRNSDNHKINTESDYMMVVFELETKPIIDGDIFINGDWTYDRFTDQYRMTYDEAEKRYRLITPLKLGYYNYQFLWKDRNGNIAPLPSEGSFYQTENSYQVLVYVREQGGRTDKLVGYKSTIFDLK